MYKARTKRQHLTRLVVVYTLMALAVSLLVVFLVFYMLGYRLNRLDGKVEQGGLIQFDSRPADAEVWVDGQKQSFTTKNKLTTNAGQHTVQFKKPGYHNWQKTAPLAPGGVLWLDYARLVPTTLKVEAVATLTGASSSLMSGGKYMAIKQDLAAPTFTMHTLGDTVEKPITVTIPETAYTAGANHQFLLQEFDDSAQYILVEHRYDDKVEWLVVNTKTSAESKNITTLVALDVQKPKFVRGSHTELYVLEKTDLRRVKLGDGTISRPLAIGVASYAQYDDKTVTYTTVPNENGVRSVGYYTAGAAKPRVVKTVADRGEGVLDFRVAEYYNEKYFAVLRGQVLEVLKGDMPSSDSDRAVTYTPIVTTTLPASGSYVRFSPGSRFVMVQNAAQVYTYDLELKKPSQFDTAGQADVATKFEWIDNFMIASTRDNMLRTYEFDGQNSHEIMPVLPGQAHGLGEGGKYMYAVGVQDGVAKLLRTRLILQ